MVSRLYHLDYRMLTSVGISPIHQAILQRRSSALGLLLKFGADKNDYLPPETVDLLSEDVSWHRPLREMFGSGITPIATAGRVMEDVGMTRMLLEAGADPNFVYPSDGEWPNIS
jgi:ankyrin repeat protein